MGLEGMEAVRMTADLQAYFKAIAYGMTGILEHPLYDETAEKEMTNALMALAALKIRMYGIVGKRVPDQKLTAEDAMNEDPGVALRGLYVTGELLKRGMFPDQEEEE